MTSPETSGVGRGGVAPAETHQSNSMRVDEPSDSRNSVPLIDGSENTISHHREAFTSKQVTLCLKGEPGKQVTLCPPKVAVILTTARNVSARGAGDLDTGKVAILLKGTRLLGPAAASQGPVTLGLVKVATTVSSNRERAKARIPGVIPGVPLPKREP